MLERLHLRPELGAFEPFLRDRITQAIAFDDERFARVRGIERGAGNALTIVSQFVSGSRLCDLLEAATSLPADEPLRAQTARAIALALAAWAQRTGRVTLGWKKTGAEGDGVMDDALREAGFAPYGPGFRYMGRFATATVRESESDGTDSNGDGNVDVDGDA